MAGGRVGVSYALGIDMTVTGQYKSSCLQTVRKELHDHLVRINPDKNWDFIINQVPSLSL